MLWYPVTSGINDAASFVRGVKVPVLMFAGEADQLSSHCCTIKAARDLGAAAAAAGLPFELVTYRGAGHDFVLEGLHSYDADAATDSWRRAAAKLAEYLGP
jgi:dienelactone hydrolase